MLPRLHRLRVETPTAGGAREELENGDDRDDRDDRDNRNGLLALPNDLLRVIREEVDEGHASGWQTRPQPVYVRSHVPTELPYIDFEATDKAIKAYLKRNPMMNAFLDVASGGTPNLLAQDYVLEHPEMAVPHHL